MLILVSALLSISMSVYTQHTQTFSVLSLLHVGNFGKGLQGSCVGGGKLGLRIHCGSGWQVSSLRFFFFGLRAFSFSG